MRQQIDHVLTPGTEKQFFQEQLLPPLLRGECATVMWFPHGGVRTQFDFLINHADYFDYNQLGKYKIIYIGPNDLLNFSGDGCFDLMRQRLKDTSSLKDRDNLTLLRATLEKALEKYNHVIFIMSYFNKLSFGENFLRNLYGLYQVNRQKIHFIFVNSNNILDRGVIASYGQFSKLLLQNIIYFPILEKKDAGVVGTRINRNCGLSKSLVDVTVNLVGGHPSLIHHGLSLISKIGNIPDNAAKWFASQTAITFILSDIFTTFSSDEQRFLSVLTNNSSKIDNVPDYLSNMKYVERESLRLFSPVFEAFIYSLKNDNPNIIFDKECEQILIKTLFTKEKITTNEYLLLSTFLKNPNTVISRDKISEVLWGNMACKKYSDWAIDQAIFQLRKKLNEVGVCPGILQTIRGEGYRWSQDNQN